MSTAHAQLAQWIEQEHPTLFAALYAQAISQGVGSRRAVLRGLGDDDSGMVPSDWGDATPDFSDLSVSTSDPVMSQIGTPLDQGIVSSPNIADSSGSNFLTSIGSGIANAAENVGSWLTSSSGLNTLANLGVAYFKTEAAQTNAALQTQVLQAQVARAQAGQSPLPITYVQGANGQPIPVYQSGAPTGLLPPSYGAGGVAPLPSVLQSAINSGQAQLVPLSDGSVGYTLNPPVLSSLTNTLTSNPLVWMVGAGLLLLLATR